MSVSVKGHKMNPPLGELFNHYLDKLVRPEVRVFQRSWPVFQVCGYTGVVLAICLTMSLVTYLGLSRWVMTVIILSVMATFLALTMATKIITGGETIIYYHHEIAVIAVAGELLKLLYQPVQPYLAVTILGVGTFLICGRVGCLMVGCCHGRPHRLGVCYREEHADAGFPRHFVGVRLLPVQALESLCVSCMVVVGVSLVLSRQAPGEALTWYVVSYGIMRFCLEFLRGDAERPYLWGFSEAQWISLLLMTVTVLAEFSGLLPFHGWHVVVTAGLAIAMSVVAAMDNPNRRLFHPRHVRQVAELLDATHARAAGTGELQIGQTSLGIRISASTQEGGAKRLEVFAFSCQDGTFSAEAARKFARLIAQLRRCGEGFELLKGASGVYHLILPTERSAHAL